MRRNSTRLTLAVALTAMCIGTPHPQAQSSIAIVPIGYPTPVLTEVTINNGAGDQTDPHVSGDWMSYTDGNSIRYYNFVSTADAGIPMGSSLQDTLSDISGSRIVFSRAFSTTKIGIMVFDAATAAPPMEIDPAPASLRLGAAIGGDTVAYIDFGLQENGELVIHDLATSTSLRITNDTTFDQVPSVSAGGDVVVWEHCATSTSNCDVWQAVRTGTTWSLSVATGTVNPEANPDSNGALIVYDSPRPGGDNLSDIFWRPVNGGAEGQLAFAGSQRNPNIAGDFIALDAHDTLLHATDILVYDVVNNRLFRITDTELVNEQLNDITVLPDGRLRVVWASDEDGFDQRNIRAATFELPNVAPTLAYSAETDYGTDGVDPDSGSPPSLFTYKAVYADFNNQAPSFMNVCIDGTCRGMTVDTNAEAALKDGDHKNGEQYSYATTLNSGIHVYFFEASDGSEIVRLPFSGVLTGPTVNAPATPASQITDLIALVESFNLKQGIENSLDAKLQNVLAALSAAGAGDMAAACNKIGAFINEVMAQSGKAITAVQANQLIAAANQVKAALACP